MTDGPPEGADLAVLAGWYNKGQPRQGHQTGFLAVFLRLSTAISTRETRKSSSEAKAMNEPVHPAIRRYAAGEISANKAADLLGERATVADVFVMTLQAGLSLPRPPREQEQAELKHALKVLGLE
jgi:hypothetical protein